MVTNTGTTAETASVKENGECTNDSIDKENPTRDEVSSLKQSTVEDSGKRSSQSKIVGTQNDTTSAMSNSQNEASDLPDLNQQTASNGLPSTSNTPYSSNRSYGNGVPTVAPNAPVNGPLQQGQNASYPSYGSYTHSPATYMHKSGPRPTHGGPAYPPQRYPNMGPTPTLNQLLTTPSRYPNQPQPGYSGYVGGQQPAEYQQGHPQQDWQARPQQYGGGPMNPPAKPEMSGYHPQPQQQYPPQQPGYPPASGQSRYPGPPSAQYSQYNPSMPPPVSGAQPSYGNPSRQPGYQGYSGYNMQHSSYYGQRPPHNYPPSPYVAAQGNPVAVDEPKPYGSQEQQPQNHAPVPAAPEPHGLERHMMSPNRRTPQPMSQSHPGSVQSPMAAVQSPHVPHPHPAVVQLRGPSPAPGSPGTAGQQRVNPLSPPSVRPGTPHQQGPMPRGPSEHTDSNTQSPMTSGYGQYRHYPQQQQQPGYPQLAGQPQSSYPQHMMSPQQQQPQQQMYSGNQQFPSAPQHHSNLPARPPAPPMGGKPAHPMSMPAPSYSQNQQSPAYQQQPSNCAPYYDSMGPQQHHVMQEGYSSASPTPSERRPSRQGSHPSAALPTDAQTRSGAAAAAAAAMAAAAHTAQPGVTTTPKGQPAPYYNQPTHTRPSHPNYHNAQQQSQNEGFYGMQYQRLQHPGAPPNNRMMAPPMGSPPGQRMPPPSSYASGYPQPVPPQQGHYPGHYPHASGDPNHPHPMHQGYPAPATSGYDPSAPSSQEDTPKVKTSARSASQKLHALYEPVDEPGRREFIDSVLKYWENKEIPLKNAPLMGKKTLDLYRLYQMVKERGFWQEVTEGKQWSDISNLMGLGSTSTSGFTLKKQYCKYLYGYECKMERGEEEPQEALARVMEFNRKKKLQAEQQANKDEANKSQPSTPAPPISAPPTPQPMTPQQPQTPASQPQPQYSAQGYPRQGEYLQHQMGPRYEYGGPPPPPGYAPHPPHAHDSRPGGYPPHPQGNPSAPGYQPQYPPHGAPHAPHVDKSFPRSGNRTPRSGTPGPALQVEPEPKKELTPAHPSYNSAALAPMKPPVPVDANLAAGNPFNEPSKPAAPPAPMPPASQGHQPSGGPPHPQYPPRPQMPLHDPYRSGYPPRPGMPPTQSPYSNSPSQHVRPPPPNQVHLVAAPGTPSQPTASPRNSPAYPPTLPGHPLPTRSSYPGQMPQSMYGGPMSGHHYPGLKRPSNDAYGPPSKYPRPDLHSGHFPSRYPPSQPSYRPEHDVSMRQRYPNASVPATNVTYSSAGAHQGHLGTPPHMPYGRYRPGAATAPYPKPDPSMRPPSRWPHPGTQRVGSPVPYSQLSKMMAEGRVPKRQPHPSRLSYPPGKRTLTAFPPDSVEATLPKYVKYQRKTAKDVDVVEAWRVIMALKSGLLMESTWAFNILTYFLYDQNTVAQFKLSQLPGLLDALIEHYRRCLSEVFSLPGEAKSLGVPASFELLEKSDDVESGDIVSDYTFVSKPKQRGRKKKNCALTSKYGSKFTTLPIKVEPRNDPFVIDRSELWDDSYLVDLTDDLTHIVVGFSQDDVKNKKREIRANQECEVKTYVDNSMMVVEATLEDVLSIPCSVLFPDEYDIHVNSAKDVELTSEKAVDNVKTESNLRTTNTEPDVTCDDASNNDATPDLDSKDATEKTVDVTTVSKEATDETDDATPCRSEAKAPETPAKDTDDEAKPVNDSTEMEVAMNGVDVTDKLNDVTNTSDELAGKTSDGNKQPNGFRDVEVVKDVVKQIETKCDDSSEIKCENPPPLCNGTQSDEGSVSGKSTSDATDTKEVECKIDPNPAPDASKVEKETPDCVPNLEVKQEVEEVSGKDDKQPLPSRVTCRVDKVLEERNVVLLEDEALASDGSMSDLLSGSVVSRTHSRCEELAIRLQCISNIIRGLSFIPANAKELCQHRHLMRAVSGSLLLRHKHRTRPRHVPAHVVPEDVKTEAESDELVPSESGQDSHTHYYLESSDFAAKKTRTADLFAPSSDSRRESESCADRGTRPLFSATVFQDDDPETKKAYSDPWWWDCVNRLREDSLVILCNVSTALDLSKLPDDHTALAVLEACLHWTVCPSSDASDSWTSNSRYLISPQRLSLEILTKLTLNDHNIDLILATRPFSRIEKLFSVLVSLLCDRKDQTLREFAIVLLSNLSSGDVTAARAIALQKSSLCGLLSFLEECEETGMNNRRMFAAGQHHVNCGTTEFMMVKCAKTMLSLAQVQENKSCFVKHQLRLLSLSMSQLLGGHVTSIIASVLYELSSENT